MSHARRAACEQEGERESDDSKDSRCFYCIYRAKERRYQDAAEHDCGDHKTDGNRCCNCNAAEGERGAADNSADDGENHQAHDVIEHGGCEHYLTFGGLELAEVGESACGNSDRRGSEGCSAHNRRDRCKPEHACHAVPEAEWERYSNESDDECFAPHFHQRLEVRVQSDLEQEDQHAEL